jgi:hypothetical protein
VEEKVLGVIQNLRKAKFFGGGDTYTLVVTGQRLVFAQLTAKMLKDAAAEAQRQGKAEGMGFFARWGDQLKTASLVQQRYLDMPVETILAENPANFSLDASSVSDASLKVKSVDAALDGTDTSPSRTTTKFTFKTPAGNHEFEADGFANQWLEILAKALGDRAHLKKGLFG